MKLRPVVFGLLVSLAAGGAGLAEPVIRYDLVFHATWSAATHPADFPSNAHFSPLAGIVHDGEVVFWSPGDLATPGIQRIAELGDFTVFDDEVLLATDAGHAAEEFICTFGILSPGIDPVSFDATASFDRLTLVTMIAPSPDWFAGTRGLPLRIGGAWRDSIVVYLSAYDAGTDSGATFTSPNQPTPVPDPILPIEDGPLTAQGAEPVIGRYEITVASVDGRPPYEDPDGDGLSNLEEAERGSDALVGDTDQDTVGDALDNCPVDDNGDQTDSDGDGVGSVCDNCAALSNADQLDTDDDGEGDRCDLDDARLIITNVGFDHVNWQSDQGANAYNLYRGSLDALRTGDGPSQDPASPEAEQFCGLRITRVDDAYLPPSGDAAIYLVSSVGGGVEGGIGADGTGAPRPHPFPCP